MNFFQRIWERYFPPDPVERLYQELKPFERTAYIPTVEETAPTFSADSKIGGYPYLRSQEDWPTCPNCGNHLQLFLQLDMSNLPEQPQEGLLQFFFCTNRKLHCAEIFDSFLPYSQAHSTRLITPEGPSAYITPQIDELFPERRIINWEARIDYPHYVELDQLGINASWRVYEQMEKMDKGKCLTGDKLFGWPHWVQGPEYPQDRETGTSMNMVFQLDSEINLPYMFGDLGIGHLTQSPDRPEELAFGWACT